MFDRQLPDRPSLDQYKKQAKELVRAVAAHHADALARVRKYHPRLKSLPADQLQTIALADAQLVLARQHGFDSWPQFAKHIETLRIIRSVENLPHPVATFLEVASVDRHGSHSSGTLEHAERILARCPEVAGANIYTAALLAGEATVRDLLAQNPALATAPGGPHQWEPLTYLCFSRYLRVDKSRSEAFARTARLLLEAGASANARWYETIDDPPRQVPETALYGAAGIARNPGLTRLLLEYGADPNDEETPYHVPETRDNTVLQILLDSARFNEQSLATVLTRKADWHDEDGLALALAHGANPNYLTHWKVTPFHHAIRRDNSLSVIEKLLDHGADPHIRNNIHYRNAFQMAAYHGRGDILDLCEQRGFTPKYNQPLDPLVAACARSDRAAIDTLLADIPLLLNQLLRFGGTLLARFAGSGNPEGVRILLDLGVPVDALWPDGDPYWELTKNSTALHVAAWRAHHNLVRELIARGANVNLPDARNRTPLQLAVRACTDSYWKSHRLPDSVAALLAAGATTQGIQLPTGYDAIDQLLPSS
ncbi:MAG TPA: ankyrin repeat domain-containing protein [Acidobacteriaceae bacterium]|jgi:ankyrin repeat protein|nr:ankyrin repeat domain-containing protein [Acidobacteriaceae bacterium]